MKTLFIKGFIGICLSAISSLLFALSDPLATKDVNTTQNKHGYAVLNYSDLVVNSIPLDLYKLLYPIIEEKAGSDPITSVFACNFKFAPKNNTTQVGQIENNDCLARGLWGKGTKIHAAFLIDPALLPVHKKTSGSKLVGDTDCYKKREFKYCKALSKNKKIWEQIANPENIIFVRKRYLNKYIKSLPKPAIEAFAVELPRLNGHQVKLPKQGIHYPYIGAKEYSLTIIP